MKRFNTFALFAVSVLFALCLFAPPEAHAQLDIQTTTLNGGTNNIAATTTNSTMAIAITPVRSSYVAIQPSFKLDGAGTTAVTFEFDESIDGSTWNASKHTLVVTPAGTSTVTAATNITVGAVGFLRLQIVRNPNASAITNLTLKWSQKPGL